MIKTAAAGKVKMQYCVFGTGPRNLVMIPGLSIDPVTPLESLVSAQYASMQDDFTIYLFDRRTNAPECYSIEEMAEDTVAVLRTLGLESFCLFGSSQGGMIAQAIAVNHPEMVEKLVLGSSSSRPNEMSTRVIGEWIELARQSREEALMASMLDAVYSENTLMANRAVWMEMWKTITPAKLARFITIATPIITFDIHDRLPEITCDVLVIGCFGDHVLSGPASVAIAEKLGCSTYMYGAEYGHAVYDEAPDYVERIHEFLV